MELSKDCCFLVGTYNNNKYIITEFYKKIGIYDEKLKLINKINTDKEYQAITYIDNNYYVSIKGIGDFIEVLDKTFSVVKKITLEIPSNYKNPILGINYCRNKKAFIITTKCAIYMVDKCGRFIKCLYLIKEECKTSLDCTRPLGYGIGNNIILSGAICCCEVIYVNYKMGEYNYISVLEDGILERPIYTTKSAIKAMFITTGYMWVLIEKCSCELCILCLGIECDCDSINGNNCSIIESIAEMEKCLAKILCSEAEKIKATIKNSSDSKEILRANDSVTKLIYNVTVLEFILTEKLRLVSSDDKCNREC